MRFISLIWEDIFVFVLLLWVFFTYKRMYRKNTITLSEYKLVRISSWVILVLALLDVARRIYWPYD